MKKLILILFFSLFIFSCGKSDCNDLNPKYATNTEAIKAISSSKHQIREIQSTSNSSSIKRIEYYSCDGLEGYLIIYNLSGEITLHRNVPMEIWDELKASKYMKNVYNDKIKGKFDY